MISKREKFTLARVKKPGYILNILETQVIRLIGSHRNNLLSKLSGGLPLKVEVRMFAYFDKYLPPHADGRKATVELPESANVETLVSHLGIAEEEMEGDYMPYVVIINGEHTACDAPLNDGDQVSLFPPLPGG